MTRRSFTISAIWDEEAQIYYSESDIVGLHIEAPSLEAFESIMSEVAPELIVTNHLSKPDLVHSALVDLIPTIIWRRPEDHTAAA